ncbi:MAG: SHOCT domain-containing protein [Hahellaceae bacterium]|nr:SHOCT domain-containing protein [Hahellaceae bacterium]
MNNQSLNSVDHSKLLIFLLLLVPAIFFLVGIIPVIFISFGIFMTKKNQDFSHIETAVNNCLGYICLLMVGCILSAIFWILNGKFELFMVFVVLVVICVAYMIFLNTLFLGPLKSHKVWVETNGIFSSKSKSETMANRRNDMDIIKGEKLKQYSVADELIKWAKLKEDGHISEDEFNEVRTKLLK